ncbi:hypothetical protein ACIP4W_04365 [Streptomyces sp. NPDC088846]|uniref:hypothetical protein n=1 Tax=unclassified Streptomyces TaxID=2593676 RepID=UPI0033EF77E0
MSVSRTQWCCLMAVLAVVLGLFCGPATAVAGAGAPAGTGDGGRVAAAPAGTGDGGRVAAAAAGAGPARAALPDGPAPAVASAVDRHGVPGCGKGRKQGRGEPALPGRARAAHDQAPGLAEWGLPAATGQGPVHPPVRIRLRGPASAAPTPVELSVLRV